MPYGGAGGVSSQEPKKYFTVASKATTTVSTVANSPNTFTGLAKLEGSEVFAVDTATGEVTNTGASIGAMKGTLSIQPNVASASARTLTLWAEITVGGMVWTPVEDSLRTVDVRGGMESFVTIASRGSEFPAGASVRWQMFADDAVDIAEPTPVTVGSSTVEGYSVLWELTEV